MQINFSLPSNIADKVSISDVYANYTQAGNVSSYAVDLELDDLHLRKTVKSKEPTLLAGKIETTLFSWQTKYERFVDQKNKEKKAKSVELLNEEAASAMAALDNILPHTLEIDDTVDWQSLKSDKDFSISPGNLFQNKKPPKYFEFSDNGYPKKINKIPTLDKIDPKKFGKQFNLFYRIVLKSKVAEKLEEKVRERDRKCTEIQQKNSRREANLEKAKIAFQNKEASYLSERDKANNAVDELKKRYYEKDLIAIEEYCDLVLTNSQYPDFFPRNWSLEYRPDSGMVVIDFDLPAPEELPTVVSYTYVKTRNTVNEKHLTEAARKRLYDSVIYQVCIRTLHELFEADVIGDIKCIAFNGLVTNTNLATGVEETKVIVSVCAEKEQFMEFDLSKVDPKATFKHLKGISAASLVGLTPIPPVVKLEKTDKRFVEGRDIVSGLDDSVNLAAMDWEEFEHLVRELFENEFVSHGGEVKVTQASSDGGVDAIAFDPDPIRGGKIVIQAKRYTNTVGVAAVRDLYGTVMNEGATKGILVTTSDYGADSYSFAKGKPLTLLNGNNLLSLLEKHGHKARINILEAKKYLNS